jgi:hypothetical protein
MPEKRLRRTVDRSAEPQVASTGMIVQRFKIGGVEYVQRYNRCGKACEVCKPGGREYDRNRPGHGPYWYKYIQNGPHRIKKYVGIRCPVVELQVPWDEEVPDGKVCAGGDVVEGAGAVLPCPDVGAGGDYEEGSACAGDDARAAPAGGCCSGAVFANPPTYQ